MHTYGLPVYSLEGEDELAVNIAYRSMESLYDLAHGKPDNPHRHTYYTLILVEEANGKHIIDFEPFNLEPNQVYLIKPRQVHQLITSTRPKGHVLVFKPSFLVEQAISCSLIKPGTTHHALLQLPNAAQQDLLNLVSSIRHELDYKKDHFETAVGAWLKLIFVALDRIIESTIQSPHESHALSSLKDQFFQLLESNFQAMHKVSDYAKKLGVSTSHLQHVLNEHTGKSVKSLISEKLVLETKRMLIFTEKNGKEIAFELGFEDPAHFSKFFKKETGLSLTNFRQLNQK